MVTKDIDNAKLQTCVLSFPNALLTSCFKPSIDSKQVAFLFGALNKNATLFFKHVET